MNNIDIFSAGIDSVSFCIPKVQLIKFLKKFNLYANLRLINRNNQVKQFIHQKYNDIDPKHKKYKMRIRYVNIIPRVKSLSNTILVFENTKQCHEIARKNKKKLDMYCIVLLAGLHQPSKNVYRSTNKILTRLLRRFSVYTLDLAFDFLNKAKKVDLNYLKSKVKEFIKSGGDPKAYHSTLYINSLIEYTNMVKIVLYDKYKKQKFFHKEDIPKEYSSWDRLEIQFRVRKKFYKWFEEDGLHKCIKMLSKITWRMIHCSYPNLDVLNRQVSSIFDLRKTKTFKKIF